MNTPSQSLPSLATEPIDDLRGRRAQAAPAILADLLDHAAAAANDLQFMAEYREDEEAAREYRDMRLELLCFLKKHERLQARDCGHSIISVVIEDEDLPF